MLISGSIFRIILPYSRQVLELHEEAISSIRRAIEHPLLHARIFSQYDFSQPKGFLLYGPPGCGKTLIGQATANSLAQLLKDPPTENFVEKGSFANAISSGAFLHIKGPEILNMWVGESERIIRDLFQQARERRKAGALPFLFIDEAESISTPTILPENCDENLNYSPENGPEL